MKAFLILISVFLSTPWLFAGDELIADDEVLVIELVQISPNAKASDTAFFGGGNPDYALEAAIGQDYGRQSAVIRGRKETPAVTVAPGQNARPGKMLSFTKKELLELGLQRDDDLYLSTKEVNYISDDHDLDFDYKSTWELMDTDHQHQFFTGVSIPLVSSVSSLRQGMEFVLVYNYNVNFLVRVRLQNSQKKNTPDVSLEEDSIVANLPDDFKLTVVSTRWNSAYCKDQNICGGDPDFKVSATLENGQGKDLLTKSFGRTMAPETSDQNCGYSLEFNKEELAKLTLTMNNEDAQSGLFLDFLEEGSVSESSLLEARVRVSLKEVLLDYLKAKKLGQGQKTTRSVVLTQQNFIASVLAGPASVEVRIVLE